MEPYCKLDFFIPKRKAQIIKFFRDRGIIKLGGLRFEQLRAKYIQYRLKTGR